MNKSFRGLISAVMALIMASLMLLSADKLGFSYSTEIQKGQLEEPLPSHDFCLFAYGDELCTIEQGTLVDYKDEIYVDAERFFKIFGYSSKVYMNSKLLFLSYYNHKLLFMDGLDVFHEVNNVFVKGQVESAETESAEGNKESMDKPLSAKAVFLEGRMYVPLSDVVKILDIEYNFENYGTIELPNADMLRALPGYHTSREEVLNFARIIYYETRDSSLFKKIAVGGVIMNRVSSPEFPNTINDIIFAPNQFPPAHYSGFATLMPGPLHFEGAVRALNGENNAPGCLFFNLAPFPGKEDDFYDIIEGDYFYY